jgi:hypothetical protein
VARKTVVTILTALAMLAFASTAVAASKGDWPDSRLDAAAASVAGHPVQVWCEGSWGDWIHAGDQQGVDFGVVFGFTVIGQPVIYIDPSECLTLHAMLANDFVGSFEVSIALLTLAHESVHQRGIADEGQAECTALPLVPGLAVNFFGYPETVPQTKIVSYTKTVVRRIKGKTYRFKVRSQKAVTVQVANPFLAYLATDALAWHRTLPPAYQAC